MQAKVASLAASVEEAAAMYQRAALERDSLQTRLAAATVPHTPLPLPARFWVAAFLWISQHMYCMCRTSPDKFDLPVRCNSPY